MNKTLCRSFLALSFLSLSSSIFANVPGWPTDRIAMGTAVDGGQAAVEKLKDRHVDTVFTYAGNNGAGDRGQFISFDKKVDIIVQQARDLEKTTGQAVRPVIVFYTVDGSDGTWAMQQDLDIDPQTNTNNLYLHYANLIQMAQQLQNYKDTNHSTPASLILNPDFLGEMHKQCGEWYCPIPFDQPVNVSKGLTDAIQFLTQQGYIKTPVTIPAQFLKANTTIADYVASVNWIIHTFAPDVPFGWQDNIWAGDEKGHGWIHQATQQPSLIDTHVSSEASFLTQMQVFSPAYRPHFIVFDKWERDVFDSQLNGAGLNNGYLYNSSDWDVYMQFVGKISQSFSNVPVMLWQIPGGHLQLTNDIDQRNDHASTAPNYFLGDTNLNQQLNNVASYIAKSTLTPASYYVSSNKVMDYLACPANQLNCWQKNRLADVKQKNVFAILWGGGSTTGVVGISDKLDDNGWLYQHLR